MLGKKIWSSIIIILLIFLATSYFSQKYQVQIGSYISNSSSLNGSAIYLTATILSTVIAPVTTLPIVSVVSTLWGSFVVSILTIAGWTIGGLIGFWIAKKYGQPVVAKFASKTELEKIERLIPKNPHRAFWTTVLLRIMFPTDILNYALGLFSNISTKTYFWGTLVGVIPSAIIFSYTGTLSLGYQVLIFALALTGILLMIKIWEKRIVNYK